jgi:hypothetical protein
VGHAVSSPHRFTVTLDRNLRHYIVSIRSEPLRSEQPRPCWKLELHVEDSIVLCSRPRALLSHTNRVHVRIARNECSKGDAGF